MNGSGEMGKTPPEIPVWDKADISIYSILG